MKILFRGRAAPLTTGEKHHSPGLAKLPKGAVLAALFLIVALQARAETPKLSGEIDAQGLRKLVASQKGHVVLVNFWATWCVPCREEFPDLVKLQRHLGPRGLQVFGISTDLSNQMPEVEKFIAIQRPEFPNYHKTTEGDDQDFIDAVDKAWGGELPFSVLYDRTGKKVKTLSGKHSYADYQKEVEALLK